MWDADTACFLIEHSKEVVCHLQKLGNDPYYQECQCYRAYNDQYEGQPVGAFFFEFQLGCVFEVLGYVKMRGGYVNFVGYLFEFDFFICVGQLKFLALFLHLGVILLLLYTLNDASQSSAAFQA